MKKIFTIFVAIQLTTCIFAQVPQKMSYQAVIRNSSNALVISSPIGIKVSILQGSASGAEVFAETHIPTTNSNGLVSLEIGGGVAVTGTMAGVDWANGPFFIKTETDPTGVTNYTITGTSQLLSVPYALYAKSAGSASGGGNFAHYIGEEFGAGVIFHLWKDALGVEHGLIVDKTDLSAAQVWSNIDTSVIGSSAQSSWDGLINSNAIVSQAGHTNSAAALCLNSTNGGKSDWYLPSIQELNMLWNNYYTVARSFSQIIGATQVISGTSSYWSSSEEEYYGGYAWYFYFGFGYADSFSKNNASYVRAVRAF